MPLRYTFLLTALLIVGVTELLVSLHWLTRPHLHVFRQWESLVATLFCLVTFPLMLTRRLSTAHFDRLLAAVLSLVLTAELIQSVLLRLAPDTHLLFFCLFVILDLLAVLPFQLALGLTALFLGALLALMLRTNSVAQLPQLSEMSLVVLLMLKLAFFGRSASRARQQSEHNLTLALTDPLTGLQNRRAMQQHLNRALEQRRGGTPCVALMLDLDHFKQVNDQYGHAVGDQVLQLVSRTLKRQIRSGDQLARWGGEEFLILLSDTEAQEAEEIMARLCLAVSRARAQALPSLTVSCGGAPARASDTADSLVQRADQHMYAAKLRGRNQALMQLDQAASV